MTTVDQMEMCLKYHWWSNYIDPIAITSPGVMWKGMGNQMICYPNFNQYVYFRQDAPYDDNSVNRLPISVRTQDGLSIDISMEFVYRIQPAHLYDLYMLTGDAGYKHVLINIAEGALDNEATIFTATTFYLDRAAVQDAFTTAVRGAFAESLFLDVVTLQLQPAGFPDAYAASITNTQVTMQDGLVAVQENHRAEVQKETELATARLLAERAQIEANAAAMHIALQNQAEVEQFIYRQEREADGYQAALAFFHTESDTAVPDFLKYLGAMAMSEHRQSATSVWLHDTTR